MIDLDKIKALKIDQWQDSPKLIGVIDGILDTVYSDLDPNSLAGRHIRIDDLEGIWLDYLGTRLSYKRPFVPVSGISFFGFRGSDHEGFRVAGEARGGFRFPLQAVIALNDIAYRCLLKAKARLLLSSTSKKDFEDALAFAGVNIVVTVDESDFLFFGEIPTVNITVETSTIVFPLWKSLLLSHKVPGVQFTITRV